MPSNLSAASPSTVLPESLCSAFEQSRTYECNVNEYVNGESQREVKASSSVRRWRQSRKLTASQLVTLIGFYNDRKGGLEPFYLYDPWEASGGWGDNYDSSGTSGNGRFTVVFEGPFGFTLQLGRAEVSFGLREVA